jgi:DNA-binding HxlR family transcriptional regulator
MRSIPGLSKKMMTQTLREMELSGLVERRIHHVIPPCVDYILTPLGQVFIEPIEMLYDWSLRHQDEVSQLKDRERVGGRAAKALNSA